MTYIWKLYSFLHFKENISLEFQNLRENSLQNQFKRKQLKSYSRESQMVSYTSYWCICDEKQDL